MASVEPLCPYCGKAFPGSTHCPEHGLLLQEPSLPAQALSHRCDPLLGTEVNGRYAVLSHIGSGGMGTIYAVEDLDSSALLAMKVLRLEVCESEEIVARFQREALAATLLCHPHIAELKDFGICADARPYIVYEYLKGEDLFDRLHRCRFLPSEQTMNIMRQVCSALSEAHAQGIIHRDLKPENIFLLAGAEFPDYVKVIDFGIAKLISPDPDERVLTREGMVFGTPEYLSPEQAAGVSFDGRADLYSLGVIMYFMLSGRLPFRERKRALYQHIHEAPVHFDALQMPQAVPPELTAVVFRLLEKDPARRFASAARLGRALEDVLSGVKVVWTKA